jgi:hypothetical protein
MNGRLDLTISYPSMVTANSGDFRVGKDPERPGPRMLLAHPKLWYSALTEPQVCTRRRRRRRRRRRTMVTLG